MKDTRRKKITRNALKCKKCGDIIESTFRHDFKYCKCGSIFIDGGYDYLRRGGDFNNAIELSEEEYEEKIEEI